MSSLSIIIPWHNRFELATTLKSNYPFFKSKDIEVIIVNCGGDSSWLKEQCKHNKDINLKLIEIEKIKFNKCLAQNMGVYNASGEALFFLDADIILIDNFISKAIKLLKEKCYVTIDKVFETNKKKENSRSHSHLKSLTYKITLENKQGTVVGLETNHCHLAEGSRSAPGLVMLTKKDFKLVNGMNSQLQYWGWEDLDLLTRLQFKNQLTAKKLGIVKHLSHGDNVRNLGARSVAESESKNFALCLSNYAQGQYLGTYSEDVNDYKNLWKICEYPLKKKAHKKACL